VTQVVTNIVLSFLVFNK